MHSNNLSFKFLLPGMFLFLLGVGNIGVGLYKGAQYQEVLKELAETQSSPKLTPASPLLRLEYTKQTVTRLYQRQSKAKARKDFYELVTFGGKVFVMLSLVLILASMMVRYLEHRPVNVGALPARG